VPLLLLHTWLTVSVVAGSLCNGACIVTLSHAVMGAYLPRAVQVQLQYNFECNILYSYCIHIVIIFNLYVMCINDVM
jgi:hypothetical protein